MKYLNVLFLLVALGLFSCKSKDNADGDNPKNAKKGATKEAVIESQISTDLASVDSGDKFTMDNVRIEGNFMYVNVSYTNLEIVVFKNKKLELYNIFCFSTKEDFIYYILFVAEQLKLNL